MKFILSKVTLYQRISNGSCENSGIGSVTNRKNCDSAAFYLNLTDTKAFALRSFDRPNGCIYASNDWLQWNEYEDASASCGSLSNGNTYDCICDTLGM